MATEYPIPAGARFKDLTKEPPFGRWTVVSYAGKRGRWHFWNCVCICGVYKAIQDYSLRSGGSTSCGCTKGDAAKLRPTYKRTKTPMYLIWRAMINRCYNKNVWNYARYGGAGKVVCQGMRTFDGWLAVIGERPSPKHQIDREDNNGVYSCGVCAECLLNGWPRNVRWATAKEQARNRRSNTILEFNGKSQCIAAWEEEVGISKFLIAGRLHKGWSVERALTEPVHNTRRKRSVQVLSVAPEPLQNAFS